MNYLIEPENNVHDIEELSFHNNYKLVSDLLQEWIDKKPNNNPLKHMSKAVAEIGIYVLQMQKRQREYDDQISKSREQSNHYKNEIRKLEKQLLNYEHFYKTKK